MQTIGAMFKTQTRKTDVKKQELSEDFLMRVLRISAIAENKDRFISATFFLPENKRGQIRDLVLAGDEDDWFDIVAQAETGRGMFSGAGRSTSQELRFGHIIAKYLSEDKKEDIIVVLRREIAEERRVLRFSDLEHAILACIEVGHLCIAAEIACSLPFVKRVQINMILTS